MKPIRGGVLSRPGAALLCAVVLICGFAWALAGVLVFIFTAGSYQEDSGICYGGEPLLASMQAIVAALGVACLGWVCLRGLRYAAGSSDISPVLRAMAVTGGTVVIWLALVVGPLLPNHPTPC
jgi:hypothetical protein